MSYDTSRDITILTGEANYDRAIKTFGPGKDEGDPPVKLSDYVMGKTFCQHVDQLIPDMELESLRDILESYSDRMRSFRVYGRVKSFVVRGERIERNSEFLDDPGKLRLFELDVDGWGMEGLFNDFVVGGNTKKLREVLHALLAQRGLEYLMAEDCLLMYSQSAFPGVKLKCHVYYWLRCAEGEGFTLEELRRWAMVVNTRLGGKHIDSSVYRAVQPDYIATRQCNGFTDPMVGARFVMIEGDSSVETETAYEGIKKELGSSAVGAVSSSSSSYNSNAVVSADGSVSSNPDGWYATLHQAGTGGEINQWCFRAAAQCVQTNGRTKVIAELDALATRMHAEAWSVIVDNSNGDRGGAEDRTTYNVIRFSQYLRSACDRNFGDEVDRVRGVVEDAITRATSVGTSEPLFERHVLASCAVLSKRWPGVYDTLRTTISSLPKGIRPRIVTYDAQVTSALATSENRVTAAEALEALGGSGDVGGVVDGGFIRDGGSIDEISFCNVLLGSLDIMSDGINDFFIDTWNDTGDGGYKAYNLQDRVDRVLAVRGMEVLGSLGRNLPEGIVKKANNVLDSYMEDSRGERGDGYIAGKKYGKRDFRRRFYREFGGEAFWINLGREDDNVRRCMRVDVAGCKRMTWTEALDRFESAPVWAPGVVGSTVTMRVGANGASSLCGDELTGLMKGSGLRSCNLPWLHELWRLVRLEDSDDESKVLSWLISVMLDWPTKFILQLVGSASAGKSTTSDILRGLMDPPIAGLKSLAETRRSLGGMTREAFMDTVAKSGDVTVIDNITGLTAGQQDMLCTIATGTSVSKRWLYHNSHYDMPVRGSIILTGINDSLSRPDLRERVFTVGIRGDSEGEAYVKDLESAFAEKEGIIRDGLIDLCSAVLSVIRGDESSAFSGRHGLIDVVNNIYHGEWAAYKKAAEKISSAESDVELDHFSKCFGAWLLNSTDYDSEGCIMETHTTILRLYSDWVRKNSGKNFSWVTASGDDMAVRIIGQVGLKSAVPGNARKLSEKLNTYGKSLSEVIGVDIGKKKVRGVRLRVLKRVVKINSDELDDKFTI